MSIKNKVNKTEEKLPDWYNKSLTVPEMAKIGNISEKAVYSYLSYRGLPYKKRWAVLRLKESPIMENEQPKKHRYLIGYNAFYAYSESKFDGIYEWDGKSLDDLKKVLKDEVRAKRCNGRRDVSISVTLNFCTKLD